MRESGAYSGRRAGGMAAAEVIVAVAIVVIVIVIVAVLLPDARRRSQMAGSLTNLQRMGATAADYGQENADSVFSFTWRAGLSPICDPSGGDMYQFPIASSDLQAAANQAICILRRQGRLDITAISNWAPHLLYSHLALADYMGELLPSRLFISPGDRLRMEWANAVQRVPADPNGPFFQLSCRPSFPQASNNEKRWPFSSSYELPPSFFSPDVFQAGVPTFNQGPTHRTFNVGNASTPLGQRRLSEVVFPSQKVMMFEVNQRFFGQRELFALYPEARVPVLLSDGSAAVRLTQHANNGWDPNIGTSFPTRVLYQPELSWEPPTSNGTTQEYVNGSIRWTQRGLQGRDFGGPEVPPQ